ncbi:Glycosyl hydrolases family 8 [Clostridium cavendishii DSM 21758]|uniref:Glycosyl hydrolases family 8 n=1 Tax=Clostridium cavendishii DSM 21758 TaxID=1121302 RepID=A0A1M6EQC1_9CLOT|nr:glycosyl hydrolase family 8 [Clostridium cavendishii]SHI87674.1 Glycosyl hydrolases family 8 [Clostridium cavendishii DSM 21758]
MIYNKALINKFSQKVLNKELISFYNQWKNRYLRVIKNNNSTLEYLFYTLDQPMTNNAVTCSEAMGYGMIIFPIMSKFDSSAKKHFINLYNYIKTYPSFYNKNLMAWQQIKDSNNNIINSEPRTSSATDGDMDISYSLLIANKLWKDDNIDYRAEALIRINALMKSCVNKTDYILTLGDWVEGIENNNFKSVTRSSDFMIYIIKEFIKVDSLNKNNWILVIKKINSIINNQLKNQSKFNGLMPDFFIKDKNTFIPPKTKILESIHDGDYFYNSCRVPFRYSMDTLINNAPIPNQINILNRWIKKSTNLIPRNIKSGYYLANGIPGNAFGVANDLSFVAPFLISSLVEKNDNSWKIELFKTLLEKNITNCTFYENTLKLIAMIICTGNWISPS